MSKFDVDADALQAMVEFLTACNVRDGAGGGVSPVTLVKYIDADRRAISETCGELAEQGDLVKVQGIGIESNRPRPSYLPPDHPDAPDAEAEDAVLQRGVTG